MSIMNSGKKCQFAVSSIDLNNASIAKIKIKVVSGITKNEPKYIVVDKKNVIYDK